MDIRIKPRPLYGSLRAISSKSDAHRMLIGAALSGRLPTDLSRIDISEDIEATLRSVCALMEEREPIIDCGESGSTLRFLLPVAAVLKKKCTFTGRGRLPERPMTPLLNQLAAHGCSFTGERLPITVCGMLRGGMYALPGDISSQYITGLLFALPLAHENSEIHLTTALQSAGYVGMTLRTLRRFGITVEETEYGYRIPGGQTYKPASDFSVEGDWSNASFFLVSGAMNGSITVSGLPFESAQSDKAIGALMEAYGAEIGITGDEMTVRRNEPRPLAIDVSPFPDLFPVLAVAACAAEGTTTLYNAARLRLKESDRIASTAALIASLGGSAAIKEDQLLVHGRGALHGGSAESYGDHRIVMAAAAASVICREDVVIRHADAVKKSYPDFFRDFQSVGGIANVI